MRSPLVVMATLIGVLVALPVLSVGANLLAGDTGSTWSHLASTVLPEYVLNSLLLSLGVGLGVALLGVSTAWFTAMTDFPGRRVFEWALLLPLAMPAYVMAYVYTDLLQFVGPIQTFLRESFAWRRGDYWFPEIRSLGGAMLMFICVLYPYVYLLARTAFLERGSGTFEAARSLGLSPWGAFYRVSLPLARPAVAAGVALVLMETLADYGTVAYFSVPTFTTGIYRAWFSLGDRVAAAQLAGALLMFVLLLLAMERLSRGRARFHETGRRVGVRRPLAGWHAWAAHAVCQLPLLLGFLLPAGLLLKLALEEGDSEFGVRYAVLAQNSLLVAGISAVLAVLLAILLAYGFRLAQEQRGAGGRGAALFARMANRVVGLGYAVPGSVIAVGVLIPVTRLDHWLGARWLEWFGTNPGLILTGTVAALIYAYLARFLAIALHTIDSGLARVTPSMDAAAKSLGCGPLETLRRVHVPLLSGSVFSAGLLVFVDVMKELPATLVMRPFNFDTLATQTYTLAADERLAEASTAALAIVAVGLLPVMFLARQVAKGKAGSAC
ncbi:MAG: iron ABC transporter permease [Rhodocyclaceae bacterium]|nr:iron ABC transporter permease [Rhodocyclaceae bacterium]MDZ4213402.1 iron ABC transporter permease [Rhodocyclaceae bacterium]